MTDETTTEQLVEIEGQATGYTPPEGWRVLAVGEVLRDGDMWVWPTNDQLRQTVHVGAVVGANQRYIRPIEPEPQPDPQPESDAELRIRLLKEANDSQAETIGRLLTEARDLNMEIGGLERRLSERDARIRDLETMHAAATQAVVDAGKQNDALRNQLAAVKAELASVAADRQRLRVELDAAQQVPADSPELRQLRADLEEVTRERDQHLDSYQRIFGDLETIRETTKAAAVEAIAEWLEPIRLVDHPNLANETLQHLPQIMRTLTGLDSHVID